MRTFWTYEQNKVSVFVSHYQEAVAPVSRPTALECSVLQQCQEVVEAYVAAICLSVKKVEVADDHALAQARENLYALEQQYLKDWAQYRKLPDNAAAAAIQKLQDEGYLFLPRCNKMRVTSCNFFSLDESPSRSVSEQKETMLAQQEAPRCQ